MVRPSSFMFQRRLRSCAERALLAERASAVGGACHLCGHADELGVPHAAVLDHVRSDLGQPDADGLVVVRDAHEEPLALSHAQLHRAVAHALIPRDQPLIRRAAAVVVGLVGRAAQRKVDDEGGEVSAALEGVQELNGAADAVAQTRRSVGNSLERPPMTRRMRHVQKCGLARRAC